MSQKLWIYQPWLDALGLEMPTTTDEFEQVLLAFKEQDPNGNGQADEIPLSTTIDAEGWQNSLDRFFMNSFIYNPGEDAHRPWLILQEGKVTPVYNTPQWKEGLKYLQRLYAQGLIDPQSFTQDIDGLQRLGNNPDEVILGAAPSGWMGVFIAVDEELQDTRWTDYVPVPPLEGPQGVRYAAWGPATGEPAIVITSACKDPALAVRWIDAQYDREATLRSERGVLGEDWRWAEEGETDYNGEQAAWKILRLFTDEPTDHAWQGTGPKFISRLPLGIAGRRPGQHRPRVPAGLADQGRLRALPAAAGADPAAPGLHRGAGHRHRRPGSDHRPVRQPDVCPLRARRGRHRRRVGRNTWPLSRTWGSPPTFRSTRRPTTPSTAAKARSWRQIVYRLPDEEPYGSQVASRH